MTPHLVRNVNVDGTWWGPAWGNANEVPLEVAARIVNPKAWEGGMRPVVADVGAVDPWPGVPSYEEGARAEREAEATEAPVGYLDRTAADAAIDAYLLDSANASDPLTAPFFAELELPTAPLEHPLPPVPAPELPTDRGGLQAHARGLGIDVDGRWGRKRLLAEIHRAAIRNVTLTGPEVP